MYNPCHDLAFTATGIGSVPFTDLAATCSEVLAQTPCMPFWPQFVKRSPFEDMSIQFSEGLPLLKVDTAKRSLCISPDISREAALVAFYDRYLKDDLEAFAISREYAPGLYLLLEELGPLPPQDERAFVKGQTVGPVTFAAGIPDTNGKPVLHNPELLEALTSALAIKARWQVNKLAESARRPVLFLDEPYLAGFGSAFSPIQRDEVVRLLGMVIGYLRVHTEVLVGIHCCGNTDWPMILEVQPDIVNFDAFDHLDYFLLYPKEITRFIDRGGYIAWGIVPTSEAISETTVEALAARLDAGIDFLAKKGISRRLLSSRSLLTPACGMGSMSPEAAHRGLTLLHDLSRHLSER